jgi:hypothetical protein
VTDIQDLELLGFGKQGNIASLSTKYEDCIVPQGIALAGDPKDWPIEERPWIYVAGYYTACPSQGTANAAHYAKLLTEAGWNAFVPHFSLLYDMFMPMPPDYWYRYDRGILSRMDFMFVCPDPLTTRSRGVAEEILYANTLGVPILREVIEAKDRYDV